MNLVLKTAPEVEPLTLDEAKLHLRITQTAQDDVITALIVSARQWIEEHTGRPLITQTWTAKGGVLPCIVRLLPNLQSISSVKYLDSDNVQQTLASSEYVVVTSELIGTLNKASGASYPTVYDHPEAVEIEFIAGYGLAVDVPQPIKQAMLLMIGHLYTNRESTSPLNVREIPFSIDALLSSYQIPVIR